MLSVGLDLHKRYSQTGRAEDPPCRGCIPGVSPIGQFLVAGPPSGHPARPLLKVSSRLASLRIVVLSQGATSTPLTSAMIALVPSG
jgi:hypothetical protein